MKLQQDTFSLLQPIFARLPLTVTVDSVVSNGGGLYTLNTSNTLWLTIGYTFTFGGNQYIVKDLITNEWVQVKGSVLPTNGVFTISIPFFDHGTFLMKNAELKKDVGNSWAYLPMCFLHEPTDNKDFPDTDDNVIGREAGCELYFLIDNDFTNWLTADHYRYAVRPMRNFMNEFVKTLQASEFVGIIEQLENWDCPNWGINIDTKGATRRLIDDELSGCGLRIDIPILKTC